MGVWSSKEGEGAPNATSNDTEDGDVMRVGRVQNIGDAKLNKKPVLKIDEIAISPPSPTPLRHLLLSQEDDEDSQARLKEAMRNLLENLRERGYAIVTTEGDDQVKHIVDELCQARQEFFNKDHTYKNACRSTDEFGNVIFNLGYVHVAGIREYLKVNI